jgi:hypothetical protein
MRVNTKLLIAVLSLCFFSVCVKGEDTKGPTLSVDENKLTVSCDGQPKLIYCFRSVPAKPYVKFLTSPGGVNILRDAPHDHLHHHGLMFALKVNETDFWSEKSTSGRQNHASFQDVDVSVKNQNSEAAFTSSIDWIEPTSEKIVLKEKRVLSLTQSKDATLLTWNTTLKTPRDIPQVKIGGAHYFGLGMRFLQSMDKNGTFMNAEDKAGKIFRGTERLTPANWCAYHALADGKPVTVAMFDHPKNFRPVTWFTMLEPFSYLSATLKYHESPFVLKSEDDLSLTYGVAVWDGKTEKAVIEQAYQAWLKQ